MQWILKKEERWQTRKLTKGFLIFGVVFIQSLVYHDHCRRPVQWYSKFACHVKRPVYDNRIKWPLEAKWKKQLLWRAQPNHHQKVCSDQVHITLSSFRIWSSRFDYWTWVTKRKSRHWQTGLPTSFSRFQESAYFVSPATILIVLTVVLSLPKGRKLQAITVSANRGQTNIRQANLESTTIKTKGIS